MAVLFAPARAAVVALPLAVLAACLNPNAPQGGIPAGPWRDIANTVNARPARSWVSTHVHWQNHPDMVSGTGRPVWAWVNDPTIHIDVECTRWPCWQLSVDPEWWLWHEIAHVMPSVWSNDEQKAMCVAEAITRREVRGFAYRHPYWNCPPTYVAGISAWLRSIGVAL